LSAMTRASVKTLVFSSSATVYGAPRHLPLDEEHPVGPTNPYGRTKYFFEEILKDLYGSDERRGGDVATCYADPTLAERLRGWKSGLSLTQMCADHWRWQMKNPNGYRGA
jgi:UDP-glucose 4-epimerase